MQSGQVFTAKRIPTVSTQNQNQVTKHAQATRPAASIQKPAQRVPVPVLTQKEFDAKVVEIRAARNLNRAGSAPTQAPAKSAPITQTFRAKRVPVPVLTQEEFDAKVVEIRAARTKVPAKSATQTFRAKRIPVALTQEQFDAKVVEIRAARNLSRIGSAPTQVPVASTQKSIQRVPVPVLTQEQFDAKVVEIRAARNKTPAKSVPAIQTFRAKRIPVAQTQEQFGAKVAEISAAQATKEVASGVPHINSCTLSGLGATGGNAVGSPVALSIQLKDQGGSRINAPMTTVSVSVKNPSYQDVPVTLANAGQGHFVAVFTPTVQGNWVVIATLNGALINGSPLFPEFH